MRLVSTNPIKPSCSTVLNACFDENGLIEDDVGHQLRGKIEQMLDQARGRR